MSADGFVGVGGADGVVDVDGGGEDDVDGGVVDVAGGGEDDVVGGGADAGGDDAGVSGVVLLHATSVNTIRTAINRAIAFFILMVPPKLFIFIPFISIFCLLFIC